MNIANCRDASEPSGRIRGKDKLRIVGKQEREPGEFGGEPERHLEQSALRQLHAGQPDSTDWAPTGWGSNLMKLDSDTFLLGKAVAQISSG